MLLKRIFDIGTSVMVLLTIGWFILLCIVLAKYDTKKSGLFSQNRVGKNGVLFRVLKIRTMKSVEGIDTTVTSSNDIRITRLGSIFRRTKIDELPQFWNVLKGDMSLVGPRPDVPGYADRLQGDDKIVLSIRPGITGPASIYFRNEETLLAGQKDPEMYNKEVIWPAKVKINKAYIEKWSFGRDLYYLWKTVSS